MSRNKTSSGKQPIYVITKNNLLRLIGDTSNYKIPHPDKRYEGYWGTIKNIEDYHIMVEEMTSFGDEILISKLMEILNKRMYIRYVLSWKYDNKHLIYLKDQINGRRQIKQDHISK